MKTVPSQALSAIITLMICLAAGVNIVSAACTIPSKNTLLVLQDAGGRKDTVMFGHHPLATRGRDTSFCENELPPPPPLGIFDLRFINPPGYEGQQPPGGMGQGFYFDYRPQVSLTQIDTHRIRFQPGVGGYPVTLSWSISSLLAMCDSAVVKDEVTGSLFTARMHIVSSLVISNSSISSLLVIKYGAAEIPATPVLVSPLDGSEDQSTNINLDWNNVTGASSYRVQVSTDSLFGSAHLDDSSVAISSKFVSGLATGMIYYWRVNAKNGAGTSAWPSVWDFTTQSLPATPVLLSPADGSTGAQTTQQLSWQSVGGALSYHAQLSTDSLFGTTIVNDSSLATTSTTIGSLAQGTTYFWRIRAKNAGGSGAWSTVWDFTTVAPVTNQYSMNGGWNLISLPLTVSDPRTTSQFPAATSPAFSFSSTGYTQQDSLFNGTGYWIKFGAAGDVNITGMQRFGDNVTVVTGWNLIGSTTQPVDTASIVQVPSGIVLSEYFGFVVGYSAVDTLHPARAYWVKTSSPGQLILPYSGSQPARHAEKVREKSGFISPKQSATKH